MIADAEPKGHRVQLLRSFGKPALKRGGDAPRVIMTEPKRTKPDPELFHFVHLALGGEAFFPLSFETKTYPRS